MHRLHRRGLYCTFTGLIICLFLGTPARAQTREQDSLALVALYNSTDGANWTDNTLWLSSTLPLSFWYGVTVSGGRVTVLNLYNNNLSGAIPSEIGDLTNLTELWLYGNNLIDSIPAEIGNLTNLTILHLAANQLIGSIPSEIGNLLNLQYLIIVSNPLTGSIPVEIGNLTQLLVLALSVTQLDGSIPAEIGDLASLTWLDLELNQLGGAVPVEVGNLSNLSNLYLHYNRLTDLPDLSGMTSLATFVAYNNQFTFEDIEPNIGILSVPYSPQDSVGAALDTTLYPDSRLTLTVPVGGSANVYQWMQDGADIAGATTDTYTITAAQQADKGSYVLKITNTIATDLTLYSRPTDVTVYTDLQVDSLALVALYNSTNGAGWVTSSNWLTANPLGSWQGVTVIGQRVTNLYLGWNDLSGPLPESIGDLTALQTLDLSYNQLSGAIPDTIGSLTSLTSLSFESNQLTGAIPAAIGDLVNLTSLRLGWNQLSGLIPPEIANLISLTALHLNSNLLTGNIPDAIGNLANLTELLLTENQLTGSIPDTLRNLTNLTLLMLGGDLSGSLPSWLGELTSLNQLTIVNTGLTGPIPANIGGLTNLTDLTLGSNQLSGAIPDGIGSLTNLITLQLGGNQLSGAIPDTIGALVNLTTLTLNDNDLSGPIPATMGNLTNVVWFWLMRNQLSGEIPAALGNLASVQYLFLDDNLLTGAVPEQLGNLPAVKSLLLGNNQLVDLPDLTSLTSVTSLAVSGNLLTFEDIEPNVGISGFTYSPQDSVGAAVDTVIFVGDPLTMDIIVGGSANQYRWKLNGTWVDTASADSSYTISSATADDAGTYTCYITNTIAPELTLISRPVYVHGRLAPFNLVSPADNTTATISNSNVDTDTLIFEWEPTTILEGDMIVYGVKFSGGLEDIFAIEYTSGKRFPFQYRDVVALLGQASVQTATGTWEAYAFVNDDTTWASNGPFGLTIDASTLDLLAQALLPTEFALHANYPNPFNPSTTVRFDLPEAAEVHLVVYDILGREVARLVNERLEPGYRQVTWNGRTAHGLDVPTGIYIARLITPQYTRSIKMVLLK